MHVILTCSTLSDRRDWPISAQTLRHTSDLRQLRITGSVIEKQITWLDLTIYGEPSASRFLNDAVTSP